MLVLLTILVKLSLSAANMLEVMLPREYRTFCKLAAIGGILPELLPGRFLR
jgi:hypothetical protein